MTDALLERVRDLAATPPDERASRLDVAEADPDVDAVEVRVLRALFDSPEGEPLQAGAAVTVMRRAGYTFDAALSVVAAAASAPDVQSAWADSSDLERRDETLLRLHVLGRVPTLTADFTAFLTLSLRSPDPSLYQAAAVAVGRHLDDDPSLYAAVQDYADDRGLDLGTPTRLDGNRTRRRVLLVQAAARAAPHADENPLPALLTTGVPVDLGGPDAPPPVPADAEDTAVILLAVRVLLDADDLTADAAAAGRHLTATLPAGALEAVPPIFFQRWGELLAALVSRDHVEPATAATSWGRVLDETAAPARLGLADRGFTDLAHALSLLDEHARTLAALPDGVGRAAAPYRDGLSPATRALVDERVRFWRRRTAGRDPPPGWPTETPPAPETASPALRAVLRPRAATPEAGFGDRTPVDADLELVGDLLAPLADAAEWRARSASDRAVHVVFLLSALQNLPGDYDRALARLRTHDIPVPPGDEPRSRAVAAVIARVLRFERTGSARFLDSRILESVADLGVLLALLPTEEPPLLAVDLADNLEHLLRWNLQLEPGFRPVQVLVRSTVRDPHPAFFDALRDIVSGRTYRNAAGELVPVTAAVDALVHDETERESDTDPWDVPELRNADPLVGARVGARDRLAAVTEDHAGVWEALDALCTAIGAPEGSRDEPPADTLLGVLPLVHPADDRMLASGADAWVDESPGAFVERNADAVASIRSRLGSLQPERLDNAVDAHDAIQGVLDDLRAVVDDVLPVLPGVETRRLAETADAVDTRLDAYTQALDAVTAHWGAGDPPRSPTRWRELVDEVTDRWSAPDRRPMLRAAFRSLESTAETDEDPWPARRRFLSWAVGAPDDRGWTDAETDAWLGDAADLWSRLLRDAMTAGQERRVRDLLDAKRFESLPDYPAGETVIGDAHEWALDHYLVGTAARVRRLDPDAPSTSPARTRLREFGAFFLHNSAMWSALVVGAVFLQDFGQAWQAMAEQGDVTGIAITFVLGITGAFAYTALDLRRKTTRSPGESRWTRLASHLRRVTGFVVACWVFALAVTTFLWWLLSGTDQVVHGPGAVLHVIVWSSFALLAGIFLGFVAKQS